MGVRASDVILGKWVIQDPEGDDVRARIVATEVRHGAKDSDLYAPTPGVPSMRVVLAHASYHHQVSKELWASVTGDVPAAFLDAPVDGTMVVRPPRTARTRTDELWLIRKAFLGLRRSPKLWSEKLRSDLVG